MHGPSVGTLLEGGQKKNSNATPFAHNKERLYREARAVANHSAILDDHHCLQCNIRRGRPSDHISFNTKSREQILGFVYQKLKDMYFSINNRVNKSLVLFVKMLEKQMFLAENRVNKSLVCPSKIYNI